MVEVLELIGVLGVVKVVGWWRWLGCYLDK